MGMRHEEGGPSALLALDPDPAAVGLGDVARDGQTRGRCRPCRGRGPGRPCRSARRSRSGRRAGCRRPGRATDDHHLAVDAARADRHLLTGRRELDRVVEQVDQQLAQPLVVAAAPAAASAAGGSSAAARRPGARRTCAAAPSTAHAPAAPPRHPRDAACVAACSIRDRSSSSLTIWTRWPVSTSILATRSRTLGGHVQARQVIRPAARSAAGRSSAACAARATGCR